MVVRPGRARLPGFVRFQFLVGRRLNRALMRGGSVPGFLRRVVQFLSLFAFRTLHFTLTTDLSHSPWRGIA